MKSTTERLVVGGVALLVGLLVGWMVRGVATYSTQTGTAGVYDDWRTACPAASVKASCQMMSDVMDTSAPGAAAPLARITITVDNTNKPIMGFTLPFGVALQAGMGLQIGKDPVKVYQYRTCMNDGCIAVTPFDDKLEKALSGTDDVHLLFAGLDGKPVSVPISLKGYNAARHAYLSTDAKRHSWFWRLWS